MIGSQFTKLVNTHPLGLRRTSIHMFAWTSHLWEVHFRES
jgi:hypothetical protein